MAGIYPDRTEDSRHGRERRDYSNWHASSAITAAQISLDNSGRSASLAPVAFWVLSKLLLDDGPHGFYVQFGDQQDTIRAVSVRLFRDYVAALRHISPATRFNGGEAGVRTFAYVIHRPAFTGGFVF